MVKFLWVSCTHIRTLQTVQKRRILAEIQYLAVECEPSVIREVVFMFLKLEIYSRMSRKRTVKEDVATARHLSGITLPVWWKSMPISI